MRKTVWYLVHDLTAGTQTRFRSQRRLIQFLRHEGCCFDNNALKRITQPIRNMRDLDDESVGELYLLTEADHELCIEELL
jgi:hypothetical protein